MSSITGPTCRSTTFKILYSMAMGPRCISQDQLMALISTTASGSRFRISLLIMDIQSIRIRYGADPGPRVERLLQWRRPGRRSQPARRWTLLFLLTMTISVACNYGAMLALTHRLTEILVP